MTSRKVLVVLSQQDAGGVSYSLESGHAVAVWRIPQLVFSLVMLFGPVHTSQSLADH